MLNKKTTLSLLISSIFALTACQSLPNSTISTNTTPKLTAHELMKHTMLHRFDKSYDYEKRTQYNADVLYQKDDIERHNVSVFLSLIQGFNSRFNKSYQNDEAFYDMRPERLACENDFRKAYNKAIKPFIKDENPDLEKINGDLEKVIADYDQCFANLPALPIEKTETTANLDEVALFDHEKEKQCEAQFEKDLDKNNDNAITNYADCLKEARIQSKSDPNSLQHAKNFETLRDNSTIVHEKSDSLDSHENNENSDYTTIDSIIEKEPSIYQMGLKRAIEKLKEIDENNQKMFPAEETPSLSKFNKADIGKMLVNMRLTPEQIELINKVYLQPQEIHYRGSYDKQTGQFSTVVEEIKETPYSQAYKRIPMLIDVNEMSVIFEPDVALPLVSLMFDKELPDLAGKSVKFRVPDALRQNIPLSMIKDSVFLALGQAYGDLNPEKFSEVMLDDYAKSIHASRVVKIHLSTYDIGFIIGRSLKYFVKDLQKLSEQHPEYIKDNENFKLSLEFLQSLNKVYRADDLAKLSQLLETVIPLSYNSFNYYYFDNQNNLISYRKINDYQSSLFNAKAQSITTNVFNYQTLGKHRYYQPKAEEIIDGNALLKNYSDNKTREQEAKDARFGYSGTASDILAEAEIETTDENK